MGGARSTATPTRSRPRPRSSSGASRPPRPTAGTPALPALRAGTEVATRNASQDAIQALAGPLPELFGGSADLSESNLTDVKANGHDHFEADHPGRNLRFGVREHGMGAIANGIAYHGGFLPYCATFLTFSDYMRGAVRLAALSGLHVIYVWTHDSVGPGRGRADAPAGRALRGAAGDPQPVVRAAGRRERGGRGVGAGGGAAGDRRGAAGPGGARAHAPEAADARRARRSSRREGVRRGGYVLREAGGGGTPELILIGTGSELQLAFAAAEALEADGIPTRVVSLPCWERFEAQDQAYRDEVLPPAVRKRVTVEVGVSLGWER